MQACDRKTETEKTIQHIHAHREPGNLTRETAILKGRSVDTLIESKQKDREQFTWNNIPRKTAITERVVRLHAKGAK